MIDGNPLDPVLSRSLSESLPSLQATIASRRDFLNLRVQPPQTATAGSFLATFSVAGAPGFDGLVEVVGRGGGGEEVEVMGVTAVRLNGAVPTSQARFAEVILAEPG